LQSRVPNQLQGRVLSLLSTIMGLAAPVGLVIATPLGEFIGVRWLFVLVGLLGTAVTLLGFLSRHVRALDDESS
jgi:DHA3 family macrolide efflux protein-like MFS transporter